MNLERPELEEVPLARFIKGPVVRDWLGIVGAGELTRTFF